IPCHATSSTAVPIVVGQSAKRHSACLAVCWFRAISRYGRQREVTDWLACLLACFGRGWALLASESRSASIRCISGADATRRSISRRCLGLKWFAVGTRQHAAAVGQRKKSSFFPLYALFFTPPSHLTRQTSRVKTGSPGPE
ncbi:uncharacterized protein CCOS01_10949, partial [Colletotrichum costaricense]